MYLFEFTHFLNKPMFQLFAHFLVSLHFMSMALYTAGSLLLYIMYSMWPTCGHPCKIIYLIYFFLDMHKNNWRYKVTIIAYSKKCYTWDSCFVGIISDFLFLITVIPQKYQKGENTENGHHQNLNMFYLYHIITPNSHDGME